MIASDEIIVPQAGHAISDSPPEADCAWTATFATGFAICAALHNLLLPRGNLSLPRSDVLHMGDRLRVPSGDVLFPPHEGFEALGEFLLARHQRVLLREHLLSRRIEFLLPLGDPPLALLELFLAGPQPFLPADERVPLFRERGPFLFEDSAVFLDFGGLILKGRLALPSVRILG